MLSYSHSNRKRQLAMPAPMPVHASWCALPVPTGDVRPDAIGQFTGTAVRFTAPGHLAWSPPI